MPEVFYQVRKKIGDIRQNLPAGIQGPFFNDEYGDVFGSIYALTATGLDYPQLKDIAERVAEKMRAHPHTVNVNADWGNRVLRKRARQARQ